MSCGLRAPMLPPRKSVPRERRKPPARSARSSIWNCVVERRLVARPVAALSGDGLHLSDPVLVRVLSVRVFLDADPDRAGLVVEQRQVLETLRHAAGVADILELLPAQLHRRFVFM